VEAVLPPEAPDTPYRLISLSGVIADLAYLNDRVDGSFMALRDQANREAGWDFLGRLDNVWWALDRPVEPGEDPYNWHKAGRAFDVVQAYNQGNPAQIELVPEQIGPDTYWRLYVRAAVQDGSLGEPLRAIPWDFAARSSGEVRAYEAGGRPKGSTPSGYYVDFTRLAQFHGWMRTPSDSTWRFNWPGVLYWQYERRDGLDWWAAMLELYPQNTLEQTIFTPTPAPTTVRTPTPRVTGTPGATTPPVAPSPTRVTPTRTPGPQS
jgi:TolB protein